MSSIAATVPRVCFESPYQWFSTEPHIINTGSSENSNVQAIAQDDEIRNICGKDLGMCFSLVFSQCAQVFPRIDKGVRALQVILMSREYQ